MKTNIKYQNLRNIIILSGAAFLLSACSDSDESPVASASITLNANVTADDIISRLEIETGSDIAISGVTGGDVADGDTVNISLNGKTFTGAVSANTFSINVPVNDLEADNDSTLEASVTTSTGFDTGEATASASDSYTVEASISATLALDGSITSDNIIDQLEIISGANIDITGTTGGDLDDGDTVTLTVNNNDFTGSINSNTFSISVPVADLASDNTVSASATTSTGNSAGEETASDSLAYTVEPAITASISLNDNVTDDDILSPDEIAEGEPVSITGTVGGDVADGDTVILSVNGNDFQTTVVTGTFTIDVPISDLQNDEDLTIEVTVTTSTGNSAGEQTATDSDSYIIGLDILVGELIDPNKSTGNQFGREVLFLSNGNIVVTAPEDDTGNTNAGAVYLYDGATQQVISSHYGNAVDDKLGSGGITELANGNFVISSPNDSNSGGTRSGSVTVVNGETGAQVGSDIIGNRSTDSISSSGIYALESATSNFVISSTIVGIQGGDARIGEIRLINGDTGAQIGNSLLGSSQNDLLGSGGVYVLSNGNFVVSSPNMSRRDENGVLIENTGELSIYKGDDASLVGSAFVGNNANDSLGSGAVVVLPNDNIVVASPKYDSSNGQNSDIGRVFVINGNTADQIGTDYYGSNPEDNFGDNVTALSNGNFVIESYQYNSNGLLDSGRVELRNGNTGAMIGQAISGSAQGQRFGISGITLLNNDNFVVSTNAAEINGVSNAGLVVLINGLDGTEVARFSGDNENDFIGSNIIALENDNYVVASESDDITGISNAGSIILFNGSTGNEISRFEGETSDDYLSSTGLIALSNSNYVVASERDDVDGVVDAGSAIVFNGANGAQVGTTITTGLNDGRFATALSALNNNRFLVASLREEAYGLADAGVMRLYNGGTGQLQTELISGLASNFFDSYFLFEGPMGYYALADAFADDSGYVLIFTSSTANPLDNPL
ncbi:Ig-like domain-containing protein [Glaciecola sp. XM2]|uniref:beta strand repeat-containing protein n=1 Tax=Glaciecola sp. XM2 TaxID=1914931 RepID=UPI001BDE6A3B|nr:Ig-like domain-containing protein [Glaciecola sp. XM2]MBT1452126.1 Ig-like domain-containing protein [Glaciecola sp. XM2]